MSKKSFIIRIAEKSVIAGVIFAVFGIFGWIFDNQDESIVWKCFLGGCCVGAIMGVGNVLGRTYCKIFVIETLLQKKKDLNNETDFRNFLAFFGEELEKKSHESKDDNCKFIYNSKETFSEVLFFKKIIKFYANRGEYAFWMGAFPSLLVALILVNFLLSPFSITKIVVIAIIINLLFFFVVLSLQNERASLKIMMSRKDNDIKRSYGKSIEIF